MGYHGLVDSRQNFLSESEVMVGIYTCTHTSLFWIVMLFSDIVRAQRELHSPVSRNKAKDCNDWLPPFPSKCFANMWKKKSLASFWKKKEMKVKGSIKSALNGKGIHWLSQKEQKIKSSNYLLDARETATACTFQKSLIQAYREYKTSPEKKGMLGKAPISKRPEQKTVAAKQPRFSCR